MEPHTVSDLSQSQARLSPSTSSESCHGTLHGAQALLFNQISHLLGIPSPEHVRQPLGQQLLHPFTLQGLKARRLHLVTQVFRIDVDTIFMNTAPLCRISRAPPLDSLQAVWGRRRRRHKGLFINYFMLRQNHFATKNCCDPIFSRLTAAF